jgi:hypothetical protein
MFRLDVRRAGGILVVMLSLVLASPVAASGRRGAAQGRAASRGAVQSLSTLDQVALVLRQVGAVYPAAGLVAGWLEEGHLIDPNGKPLAVTTGDPTGTTNSATTGTTEEGHLIDPNG